MFEICFVWVLEDLIYLPVKRTLSPSDCPCPRWSSAKVAAVWVFVCTCQHTNIMLPKDLCNMSISPAMFSLRLAISLEISYITMNKHSYTFNHPTGRLPLMIKYLSFRTFKSSCAVDHVCHLQLLIRFFHEFFQPNIKMIIDSYQKSCQTAGKKKNSCSSEVSLDIALVQLR